MEFTQRLFGSAFYALILFICFNITCSGYASILSLEPTATDFSLSFETIELPQHDTMGLAGGALLFGVNDWLYVGPGAYGAMTGNMGGFITLGMTAEAQRQLTSLLSVKGGAYVGAGGRQDDFTLVGGGLMLRPYLGLDMQIGRFGRLGAGVSYVSFPNGSIRSTQPYIGYTYSSDTFIGSGWLNEHLASDTLPHAMREFALVYDTYWIEQPNASVLNLLGITWDVYFNPNWFFKLETEGALGRYGIGYMQILLGGGYRLPLGDSTFVKAAGVLGPAGGGLGIATGGGVLLEGTLSVQQYLTRHLYLALFGGYADAPDGSLSGASTGLQVGYGYEVLDGDHRSAFFSDLGNYLPRHLRIRATEQNYFQAAQYWRRYFENNDVNLLGVQLDFFANDHIYLTGQGIGAFAGHAGAYMTGLVGSGIYLPLFNSPVFVEAEGLVGAAGGGGLDIKGVVFQGNAGLGYQLSKAVGVMGYYGYIGSSQGNFRANVFGLSFNYHFTNFLDNLR